MHSSAWHIHFTPRNTLLPPKARFPPQSTFLKHYVFHPITHTPGYHSKPIKRSRKVHLDSPGHSRFPTCPNFAHFCFVLLFGFRLEKRRIKTEPMSFYRLNLFGLPLWSLWNVKFPGTPCLGFFMIFFYMVVLSGSQINFLLFCLLFFFSFFFFVASYQLYCLEI